MTYRYTRHCVFTLLALCLAPGAGAQETHVDVINASTCRYNDDPEQVAAIFGHFLLARDKTVWCSLPFPDYRSGNPPPRLQYVYYTGVTSPQATVTVQVCTTNAFASSVIVDCGVPKQTRGSPRFTDFVFAPFAADNHFGAYVRVTFNESGPAILDQLLPSWEVNIP